LLLVCIAANAVSFFAPRAGRAVRRLRGDVLRPLSLGLRLVLMLAGAASLPPSRSRSMFGKTLGRAAGRAHRRIERCPCCFLFAVALMGDVLSNTIAQPLYVLGLLALGWPRHLRPVCG